MAHTPGLAAIEARWTPVQTGERPQLTVTGSSSPGVLLTALAHAPTDVEALLVEVHRLRARIAELERPAVEAKRNEIRQSFTALAAQASEDGDHEGAFSLGCQLREREEQWAREDAAAG